MGELAALASAACWAATSVVMARLSLRYSSAVLSGSRFLVASPFVILLVFLAGQAGELRDASAATLVAVLLSAAIGYGIGDTLYVRSLPRVGLARMSPSTTALWVALTAAGGVLLLDEPSGWGLFAGGGAVVAGVYLVVAGQAQTLPAQASARASLKATVVAIAVVASAWSIATLLIGSVRGEIGPIAIGAIRIPMGGLTIAAVAVSTSRGEVLRRLPVPRDLPLILALAVGGTAVGSLLYIYAVAEAGAARASILNSISPLMVLPLSLYFLRERPTRITLAGTALCVVGTLLVVAFG